jgi:hypothetical protein
LIDHAAPAEQVRYLCQIRLAFSSKIGLPAEKFPRQTQSLGPFSRLLKRPSAEKSSWTFLGEMSQVANKLARGLEKNARLSL